MARAKKTSGQAQGFDGAGLRALLEGVASGGVTIEAAVGRLAHLPFEGMEHSMLDHHRSLRKGFAEVIYCAGKTPSQVAEIAGALAARGTRLLGTRATAEQFAAAKKKVKGLQYDALSRVLWLNRDGKAGHAGVVVICAGTSDLPVAREAELTLKVMGHDPVFIKDVGVAGLHRLMAHLPALKEARVIVTVAGMEGALPSVVAGLVAAPVIAVPTSVGYGAAFGGVAALLAMLNSCASGLSVVNIDNGFGAAYFAAMINNQCIKAVHEASEMTNDK